MKTETKSLLISIMIPLFLGSLIGFLTAPANSYYNLNLPAFSPPAIVFPIVWTILYILMGISAYLVYQSSSDNTCCKDSLIIYSIQLFVNLLWSVFFFVFQLRLFSFFWILLLIVLVLVMIYKFSCISKLAAYLQIPYLLWLIFASILNFSIYFLN